MDDVPAGRGKPTLEEFHAAMKQASVAALWETHAALAANPRPRDKPLHWRWRDLQPLIDMATRIVTAEEADRRVLTLQNPAHERASAPRSIAPNLTGALQILLPGETAPPHRHTPGALRFVLEGTGVKTIVDGKVCPMEEGDMILTPGWSWHEHVHEGSGRMVWFDGLDAPLHAHLTSGVFEPGPAHDVPPLEPDEAYRAAGLLPDGATGSRSYSPVFRYSWGAAREALSAAPLARDGTRRLRYVNPETAGPAMNYIDCFLVSLPHGTATRPARSSADAVCVVAQGSGTSTVGDLTVSWERNDIFTMPRNSWALHTAATKDAVLFMMTDRDLMARLGMLHDEIKDA